MSLVAAASQIIIALGIFNVWLIRRGRSTPYRPDGAANLAEEFRRYGLPDWARVAIGTTKVALAILLLIGLVVTPVTLPAAALMSVLMAGAIVAHLKVRDPLTKAAPAAIMLLLSLVVVATHAT